MPDIQLDAYYVLDDWRDVVVAGPTDEETALGEAADRGVEDHLVVSGAALQQRADATTLGWETGEVRRVTDGGANPHDTETKIVRTHEEDKGQYVYLMLTRFDGEDALLGEDGWRGEYIWYSVVSRTGDTCVGGADPWSIKNRHPAPWFGDTAAADLMKGLDMGRIDWSDLSDGDHLTAEDVDALEADDADDWDPEPATLREGETPDETSHAARNAAQLRMAEDENGGENDG